MLAIIKASGQQIKVSKDNVITVDRITGKEGEEVIFSEVLYAEKDDKPIIGAPTIANASVVGEIIKHSRAKKIIIFKKKRRQGYVRKNGHRQDQTQIKILEIKL